MGDVKFGTNKEGTLIEISVPFESFLKYKNNQPVLAENKGVVVQLLTEIISENNQFWLSDATYPFSHYFVEEGNKTESFEVLLPILTFFTGLLICMIALFVLYRMGRITFSKKNEIHNYDMVSQDTQDS